jgi:hypothetical protein
MRQGLTIRKWAFKHGYGYTMVYQVVMGDLGRLQDPGTISGQVIGQLRNEGFWVDEIKENEVKAV